MGIESVFILLFVIATAVALGAQRLRLPYTAALVLAGLGLGALQLIPAPHLTHDLLFSIFLPALIFEAAFHIDSRDLRHGWVTILLLAIPGVVVSTALVGATLAPLIAHTRVAPGFDWRDALVFGALISATDPVAVVALFRSLGTPRRLTVLLEGESLLNDGTAIVFFTLSLSLLDGKAPEARQLLGEFLFIVGAGAVIGTMVGAAASLMVRHIDDAMVEITLTVIAAYGSFVLAEAVQASGVIACVAAGLICGNVGARTGMSNATRVACSTFWEYATFALNSIIFLLIGFEVRLTTLLHYWLPILGAYLVVSFGRGIVILIGRALAGVSGERFPWRWSFVLTWGGLRGALAMVLALSLPTSYAYRELTIAMTFGVAVVSILVQGLTMPWLLRFLGIAREPASHPP